MEQHAFKQYFSHASCAIQESLLVCELMKQLPSSQKICFYGYPPTWFQVKGHLGECKSS